MAGPIIEALQRMRENRMERRENRQAMRGGPRRGLLDMGMPVSHGEAMQAVGEYAAPMRRRGLFASIGTGTARQDFRGGMVRPEFNRPSQQDPAGPDTHFKRDYDGDGRPEAVRGETDDLPEPPQTIAAGMHPTAQPDALAALEQQYREYTRRLSDPRLPEDARKALMTSMLAMNVDINRMREDRNKEEERKNSSTAAKLKDAEDAVGTATRTGDWQAAGAVLGSMYTPKDDKGVPLPGYDPDTIGRKAARNYVVSFGNRAFQEHGGLGDMPADKRFALLSGLTYAFPMGEADFKSDEALDDWKQRTFRFLEDSFNGSGDEAVSDYHDALVQTMLQMHMGR